MNFSYGVIGIVGVLAAVSIVLIAMNPADVIEPRVVMTDENKVLDVETPPMTQMPVVSIPAGSAVPGCESSDECYLPYEMTVPVGSTVSWTNDDTAAHTVTSGSIDTGITDVFDSGLIPPSAAYEFTFDVAGDFDYFCIVHPWMNGIIHVN